VDRPVLAFDTSAPSVSVALAVAGRLLAERGGGQRESSARLVGWIDEALAEANVRLDGLAGILALAGPGSFTGLRVGLATALGLHQARGLPATAVPTFATLAAAAPPGQRVLALVAALPGEWYVQPWIGGWPPTPAGEPRRLPLAALAVAARDASVDALVAAPGVDLAEPALACGLPALAAPALASVAARLASEHPPVWDAEALTAPLYLAPPPTSPASTPKRVLSQPPRGRA
jgi:tRNA threonylcarbamoyladenosine biosynthesis protein TsaB